MISVIIPTWNEAAQLPASLASLRRQGQLHEVIVVDAGSTDPTREVAESHGATFIPSPRRQRAAQMNLGAAHSRGDCLLFLHADTCLPDEALAKIARALQDPAVNGGGFARRFDSPSAVLRLTCLLAEIRTRCLGWFLGDQAIFVRRAVFESLGGFRDLDLFEDLDFSRRLGRVVTLRPPVISAGRRFAARGPTRTTCRDFWLTVRYLSRSHWRLHDSAADVATANLPTSAGPP